MKNNEENKEFIEIYNWIDSVPLSRKKKFINKDFSDGVLISEILKCLYPKLVNLHNYSEANNFKGKIYNWNTLNEKIFKKINIPLNDEIIYKIVKCENGIIEQLLKKIHDNYFNNKNNIKKTNNIHEKNKLKNIINDNNKKNYKNIVLDMDIEINKLKEILKQINYKISIQEMENSELKNEIEKMKKK